MMLDEAVPRVANGGPALCHICQRSVYFAGGYIRLLADELVREARGGIYRRAARPPATSLRYSGAIAEDEGAAERELRAMRWQETNGNPVCPACKATGPYRIRQSLLTWSSWRCAACRKAFTITSGTAFASVKLSPSKMLEVLKAYAEGLNTSQICRRTGITYKGIYPRIKMLQAGKSGFSCNAQASQ